MTNDTRKSREFWINKRGCEMEDYLRETPCDETWLHVIEYSAYEALRKELSEYRAALEELTVYKEGCTWYDGDKLVEKALDKYPKESK